MRQTIERSAKIDGLEIQKWDPAVKVKSGRSYIIKLGGKYEVWDSTVEHINSYLTRAQF